MKDLIPKFVRGEDLVLGFCAGTSPTANACMLRIQHRGFVGCILDSDLLRAAELDYLLIFGLQNMNPNYDVMGDEELRAAARTFKAKVAVVFSYRRATWCEVPPEHDETQVIPRQF